MSLTELVKSAAVEAGFDLAGIAAVTDFPELAYFPQWIAQGRAGEMRYMESRGEDGELKRADIQRAFPWARSVIVCAINYNTRAAHHSMFLSNSSRTGGTNSDESTASETDTANTEQEAGNARGSISRYAWSQRDYHDVVMERLRSVELRLCAAAGDKVETRCYVDTGPLAERVCARYAGIGWIGKNTCIINQQFGSWLFLGVILTSLEVDSRAQAMLPWPSLIADVASPDRCGSCTRCLDACPTNAFIGPHQLDALRCISYLTIEKRGDIPLDLRPGLGRQVFGCDICQDVCPWNRKSPVTSLLEFEPRAGLVDPELEWLASIGEEEFRETFRGSPIKRAKRTGLRRNAVVAMGNSGNRRFLPLLRRLANDPDEILARHAQWAAERLDSPRDSHQLMPPSAAKFAP
jgi:epoxyqueuosine reductase